MSGATPLTHQRKNKETTDSLCYNDNMKKGLLSQTNPYLRDKAKRLSGLVVSVCSSSAIEGIAANTVMKEYLLKKGNQATPHKSGANEQ